MPNTTIRDKVASLSENVKKQLIQGAYNGESITSMSEKFNIDFHVIQHLLCQSGTLPWQGAKTIISRRLRSLKSAARRADRERLVEEVAEQIDYLYYAARKLQTKMERMKSLIEVS